jgi:two-component system phosphate regulon response regulator PhoB
MRHVLIIEDDPQFVEIYKLKLLKIGCKIVTAKNVPEAKSQIRAEMPDIILLDIMLSGSENGFDLLREIQVQLDETHTPVIVLTNLPADHEKTARALGAKEFFIKAQASIDEVMTKITALLAIPNHAV